MDFAPAGYPDDAMEMVGHDDKCAQFDVGSQFQCFQPFGMGNSAPFVQNHDTVFDISETAYPVVATKGDEIQASLPVIISLYPDGPAVMDWFHWVILYIMGECDMTMGWITIAPTESIQWQISYICSL
jgi:hypothetical protein